MNSSVLSHSFTNFGTSLAAGLSTQAREPLGFAAFRSVHLELIQGRNAVSLVPTGRSKLTLLCFAPERRASPGVVTPPPALALTQAAKPQIEQPPGEQLARVTPLLLHNRNEHPSLRPSVMQARSPEHKQALLEELLAREPGAVLVCTSTVRSAQAVFARLARAGLPVGVYHGKLRAAERDVAGDAFMDGRCRILVATQAFAAQLDTRGARLVVHYDLPARLESHARAAIAAGRDGSPVDSVLLYSSTDEHAQRYFLLHKLPPARAVRAWATWLAAQPANTLLDFTALEERVAQHWTQVFTPNLHQCGTLQRCPAGFTLARGVEYEALHAELKAIYQRHRRAARRQLEKLLADCAQATCRTRALTSAADP